MSTDSGDDEEGGVIRTVGDVEIADTGNEQVTVRTKPCPEGVRLHLDADGVSITALLLPEGIDELQVDLEAAGESVDAEAVAEAREWISDEYAE